jgi:hypothetical protein
MRKRFFAPEWVLVFGMNGVFKQRPPAVPGAERG